MFCDNCGKQIMEHAKFCRYCGFSLNQNSLNERKSVSSPNLIREKPEDERYRCTNSTASMKANARENPKILNEQVEEKKTTIFAKILYFIGFIIVLSFGKVIPKAIIKDPSSNLFVSHIIGGLVMGVVSGVIPYYLGIKWGDRFANPRIATWGSLIVCGVAGLVGGLVIAIPVTVILSLIIWVAAYNAKSQ